MPFLSESFKNRIKQLAGINENVELVKESNFDFSNNTLVKNMNLSPSQISTLQDVINLMLTDELWKSEVYPDGYTSSDVILDVTNFFDNTGAALDIIATQNPMGYANKLKTAIKKKKGIVAEVGMTPPQAQPQQVQPQQPQTPAPQQQVQQPQQKQQQQAQQPKFPDSNQIEGLLNNIKKMFANEKARVGDSNSSYTDIPSKFDVVIKHVKTTNNTDYLDMFMEKKNKGYLDHIIQQFGGQYNQHFNNPNIIALTMVRGIKK